MRLKSFVATFVALSQHIYAVTAVVNGEAESFDYLCYSCISKNKFKRGDRDWKSSLEKCEDYQKNEESLLYLPKLPCFIQKFDMPVCCGELCEFHGIPSTHEERADLPSKYLFWQGGKKSYGDLYDFTPESDFLEDIGFFHCFKCENKFFTFQFM
ncbi:MAG: hypothetical protein NE328_24900 [Lentisphaeraceae bacterium]|nr:hypothetical protein [Lentisphaeraceae bacterium]